ncbi:MAG TPA: TlpA disulfide reductase family protein [Terriglobales bacterium]|nr:TlpA disulfide reductase family protein [Terriglobales bacterium]
MTTHKNVQRIRNDYYIDVRFLAVVLACASGLILTGCYAHSKPTDINIPAPDFAIKDADHSVTLRQFRGKIIVLNFWATWCPPCNAEMPSLVGLQKKLQGTDVTILAISVDDDAADYQTFLKDHNVDFLTVREAGQRTDTGVIAPVSSRYGTYKLPETYIIDRNGIIRRKFIGAVDWNQPEIIEYLSRLQG